MQSNGVHMSAHAEQWCAHECTCRAIVCALQSNGVRMGAHAEQRSAHECTCRAMVCRCVHVQSNGVHVYKKAEQSNGVHVLQNRFPCLCATQSHIKLHIPHPLLHTAPHTPPSATHNTTHHTLCYTQHHTSPALFLHQKRSVRFLICTGVLNFYAPSALSHLHRGINLLLTSNIP